MEGYTQKSGTVQKTGFTGLLFVHCGLYIEKLQCCWKSPSNRNKHAEGERETQRGVSNKASIFCTFILLFSMSWPLPSLSGSAGYPTGSKLLWILIPFPLLAFTEGLPAMCWCELLVIDIKKGSDHHYLTPGWMGL